MRIMMKVAVSGTHNGVAYPRLGVETDVEDGFGMQLCQKGLAVPVVARPGDTVETAVAPSAELRRGPGRPRKTEETI